MDLNGVLLDTPHIMGQLAAEVRGISAYATFIVRNDTKLPGELARAGAIQPTTAGRRAGVKMPNFLVTGKSGKSRKEMLIQHRVVTEYRSWEERIKAANGESSKHISQGWKRTVNTSPPSYGEDTVNLGAVDKQYAAIENNPFADGEIVLKMVIKGNWHRLIFPFDNNRFPVGKVTLPVIKIQDSQPVFIFSVATDNPVVQFSGKYVIGVDVGINNYATVVVRNTKTGQIVYESTLSQRVHSLWNSVRASEKQVRQLREKAESLSLYDRQGKMAALDEAQLHREAASRKKRELAILAAQEIAYLSHFWDNAVVAVEDLGWVANTMQNGRWNRGTFVQWLTHYVSQNGGWVLTVNAANTSQVCHECGSKVAHPEHEVSDCPKHGKMDRDVNAAANIAARAVPKVKTARNTRAKSKKLQKKTSLKTPTAREALKHPGGSRNKNCPTPKRKKRRSSKGVNLPLRPARVRAICVDTKVLADWGTYGASETNTAALKQGNTAYECRLCNLN
jgi:transposase